MHAPATAVEVVPGRYSAFPIDGDAVHRNGLLLQPCIAQQIREPCSASDQLATAHVLKQLHTHQHAVRSNSYA